MVIEKRGTPGKQPLVLPNVMVLTEIIMGNLHATFGGESSGKQRAVFVNEGKVNRLWVDECEDVESLRDGGRWMDTSGCFGN